MSLALRLNQPNGLFVILIDAVSLLNSGRWFLISSSVMSDKHSLRSRRPFESNASYTFVTLGGFELLSLRSAGLTAALGFRVGGLDEGFAVSAC